MTVKIKVVTAANRTSSFLEHDPDKGGRILEDIKRGSHLFSGAPLIISSSTHTEIFAAAAIVCIEFETSQNLDAYLPANQNFVLTAMTPAEAAAPFQGEMEGDRFSARIDFFFTGGHTIATRVEGQRKPSLAERLMNITSIFERPVVTYSLPQGGIGLMNPAVMTRSIITPAAPDLPSNAWIVEDRS
jgi:hypothetical protein